VAFALNFRQVLQPVGLLMLAAQVGCATLPTDVQPEVGYAPAPAGEGILTEIAEAVAREHGPDQSGFWLLDRNADALHWRLALVDSAVSSLDLAYYLWYGHDSGRLLLKRVIRAAERGVQVRLLVDDLLLIGNDQALVALDAHPNIELRLFNPKRQRRLGMVLDTLLRFSEMNSRMHNKLIVADNRAVILGGRNIGDYYFGLSEGYNFHDLDVFGVGPIALQSSELFDNFWNSHWSVPASLLPVSVSEEDRNLRFENLLEQLKVSDKLQAFPIEVSDWAEQLSSTIASKTGNWCAEWSTPWGRCCGRRRRKSKSSTPTSFPSRISSTASSASRSVVSPCGF
jgi:putative cardiolipin synthase